MLVLPLGMSKESISWASYIKLVPDLGRGPGK